VTMAVVGSEQALDHVLDSALERDVVVRKQRHIWCLDNVKFHVDTVDELGSFLEVEAIDYDGDRGRDALQDQCHEYVQLLSVHLDDLEAPS